jgi:Acyl-CoA dehydrogenase, C-terminal domain
MSRIALERWSIDTPGLAILSAKRLLADIRELPLDEALLTQGTQTAAWIATTCVRIADTCFALGAGSALYETSPLQRRLRDLHAAAQHAIAQQRNNASAGKLLLSSSVVSSKIAGDGPVPPRRPPHVTPASLRGRTPIH